MGLRWQSLRVRHTQCLLALLKEGTKFSVNSLGWDEAITKATLRWHHNERVKTVLSAESSWVPLESSAVCGCRIVPCGTGDGPTTVVAVAGFVSHETMGVPIASTI